MKHALLSTALPRIQIEDEIKVAGAIEEGLAGEGYEVAMTHSGKDGFFRLAAESFDLAILDVMLRAGPASTSSELARRLHSILGRRTG